MLDFLHIENIAVVKKLDISFFEGFNVLTGETGAGKSVIIDSVNMLLGAKISREIIRHGQDRAVVSAFFSNVSDTVYEKCDEFGIEYDKEDSFSISRTYTGEGKNIIKINSRPATLMQLKEIGSKLINIHGQNESHGFLNKSNQLNLLDEFANSHHILSTYQQYYSSLNLIKSEISDLVEQGKQKDLMTELLKMQIKEIESAKLKDINEEQKLTEVRNKLKGAEKIIKSASVVYKALYKSESGINATVFIEKSIEALKRLSEFEPLADEMAIKLNDIKFEIEDIAERAFEFCSLDGFDNPEKQLEAVEDRLALIQRLEKKYAPTVEGILQFKIDAEKKLKAFENAENRLEELKTEYKKLYKEAVEIAVQLDQLRKSAAERLSNSIKDALEFLDMPKVQFQIDVRKIEKDKNLVLNSYGFNDVEFMIATNVGEELLPMSKIASGGELSRIILALKSSLSDKNEAETVIFDEIDTGVSGSTSQKIGIKLAKISKTTQTLCVTHSAQIAALADYHFLIKKLEKDGRAESDVKILEESERIEEIARIIGGINLTKKQFDAAKELLAQSVHLK